MVPEVSKMTSCEKIAAEAIRQKKEEGVPFIEFAKAHGISESNLHSMLNRYRIKFGITERFGSTGEVKKANGMQLVDLLIIDDFGLMPSLSIDRCRLFLDVLDARAGMRSTIIAAQIPVSSWYGLFADSTFADACMERMIKPAYRIELKGASLRC